MARHLVPVHPFDVKPLGNLYAANGNIKAKAGVFAFLPDELLSQILEWLEPSNLMQVGCTCKALYAFSRQEDQWKAICLR